MLEKRKSCVNFTAAVAIYSVMLQSHTTSLGSIVVSIDALVAKGCMFEPYDGHFLIIEERSGWEIISESKIILICSGVCFPQIGKEGSMGF